VDLGLIADYEPGSFLLAAPDRTLLATGTQHVVSESDPDELAARVTKLLVDSDIPVAVGALPFDSSTASSVTSSTAPHVVLPREVRWSGPVRPSGVAPPALPELVEAVAVPTPEEHERGVAAAVALLRAGELDKVVLARSLRLRLAGRVDTGALLASLAADNSAGYTYAVDLPASAGRRTLVGATPEMLLSRTGTTVVANPFAGSMPRDPDPEQDRRNAVALLASAKDRAEHQVVVEAVVDALRPFCRALTVPDGPTLVSTSAVWHLATRVTGELVDPGISALRLAATLHPTPAVCGQPFDKAKETIARIEPFDRGFYAGAIGWCDAEGDGQWVVGIRCAEITEPTELAEHEEPSSTVTLYAGGGIMPASQPHLELAETSAKFRTLLRAMGATAIPT
jgi:isochorismate synthase